MVEEMTTILESNRTRVRAEKERNRVVVVGAERYMGEEIARETLAGVYWSGSGWRGSYRSPKQVEYDDYVFTKASDGWHSSMEESEQSEAINAICRGEVKVPFPVIVLYTATSNVCSTGVTLYTPEGDEGGVKALLDGRRAAPDHAGVR